MSKIVCLAFTLTISCPSNEKAEEDTAAVEATEVVVEATEVVVDMGAEAETSQMPPGSFQVLFFPFGISHAT